MQHAVSQFQKILSAVKKNQEFVQAVRWFCFSQFVRSCMLVKVVC